MLNYDYLMPTKIIDVVGNVQDANLLLKSKPLQIGIYEDEVTVLNGKCSIILDFGKEIQGGVRIIAHHVTGGNGVHIRFGESVSEACSTLGDKNSVNAHSPRDFIVNIPFMSDNIYGQSGFRFVRIDTLSDDAMIKLKLVLVAADINKTPFDGSFSCDDSVINQIFDTAAYTLRLCLQNGYFWDGIKRDRLVWIGDLYPEMKSAVNLFSTVPETYNSLKFAVNETPLPRWVNTIPTYSVWWLIIFAENYFNNGNLDQVYDMLDYAKGVINQISNYILPDGRTNFHHNFIDWPSHRRDDYDTDLSEKERLIKEQDELAGVYYLTKIGFEKVKELFTIINEDVTVIDDVLTKLSKNTPPVKAFKQISALAVFGGNTDNDVKKVLLSNASMSTFMSYFILTALAKIGEYDYALKSLKEYYGGMLSIGATSFFEDFDLAWLENAYRIDELPVKGKVDIHGDKGKFCYKGFRHSLCHGWSSGVVAYLIETVLGAKPVGVGRKCFKIEPHLSCLKVVEGNVPTPYGSIYIKHTVNADGKIDTIIKAPKEIQIIN